MSKKLRIDLVEDIFGYRSDSYITMATYPYICKKTVSDKQFNDAIDMIITYSAQKGLNHIIVDLNERNLGLAPTKEMTIEEIEKELGYKIKIIK